MVHPESRPFQHRTADVELTIRGRDGLPLARREVVVEQRSHAFRFGCTGFEAVELAGEGLGSEARTTFERILELWLELFNTATLPFYWARFEAERGRPDTTAAAGRSPVVHGSGLRRQGSSPVLAHACPRLAPDPLGPRGRGGSAGTDHAAR